MTEEEQGIGLDGPFSFLLANQTSYSLLNYTNQRKEHSPFLIKEVK